ncbi:MAG: T9SS type A sorting domain-containing protein [Candidatus Krumholzibacteria bacterium]|jgi:hypothetical protein|nr:T9SS type A sorting domain-containing protein [Candidatus Krumholzibacteria bacterium]
MKARFLLGALVAMLLMIGVASAKVDSAEEFLAIVQQRVDSGELTAEEALLLKFHYAFDRERLPEELQPTWLAPMKCGTPLIIELEALRGNLRSDILATIEGYLAPPEGSRAVYMSPLNNFRITYETSGQHAVPAGDANSNGIPDWVELMGEYFEYVFDFECNQLGFQSPPIGTLYPYMSVSLESLSGIYGYTQVVSSVNGMTRIVLHNNYVGFPPNDDPDGDQLGAAKVTIAHEFKHSTQYAGSRWSEGDWVECDATWMEEIAYPAANDYLNYLTSGSPISSPATTLNGSYEDCVWQHYLSETHGIPIIVDYWIWRKTHQGQGVIDSYDQMIINHGASLQSAWNEFTAWNFASGVRWLEDQSYAEGFRYPTGSAQRTMTSYPSSYNSSVARLAANFIRCLNVNSPGYAAKVTFSATAGERITLAAIVNHSYLDYTGAYYLIPLGSNNQVEFVVPYDLDGVYSVGFVVGNANKIGVNQSYSISVELVPFEVDVADGLTPQLTIAGNYPNPFNPSTSIKFALGTPGRAQLEIYDVSGRKVRTLLNAILGVGEHTVQWNGLGDDGHGVPSGTYFARLSSGDQISSHKLLLAR